MAGSDRVDVLIAGGGAAGLSLALALKQAAGRALSVLIADPALAEATRGDSRAYAIVSGSRRFFDSFDAWEQMATDAEPIQRMEITDSSLEDIVRPLLLGFAGGATPDDPFAHMVPNGVILAALVARAKALDIPLLTQDVRSARPDGGWQVADVGGQTIRARLVVAADGRASRLREAAGISYFGWSYPQVAIVGTVTHSLPHEGVAVQHFLPSGPFALLPLKGNHCSIVWSERLEVANRLLTSHPDDLLAEVDRRSAGRFGSIRAFKDVASFPLSLGIARTFVGERLALLGDAAHGYHPLAGQGLNYGLRGAAALAETIIDAARLGLDIGAPDVLANYESNRRPDAMAMAAATEALNRLFSTDSGPLRHVRDLGLGLVNRAPRLKARLLDEAAGAGGLAPRVFRGEAL